MANQQSSIDLITLSDPHAPASEAYRTLRTNLEFMALNGQLKTLIVTTPAFGKGKSNTLANLAVTIAQGGRSVVLVDADLRRPEQHQIFGLMNKLGLSNTLLDETLVSNPKLIESGIQGLKILPAGPQPPNPAELLASSRMSKLIESLSGQADIILFDSPPVIPVTDASILGRYTDGLLLVLQSGETKREHAVRARALLEQVGVRLIGTVLTNARVDSNLSGY